MKEPQTIKGYLSLMNRIELMSPVIKKGYDELPESVKGELAEMTGQISNAMAVINQQLANK